MGVLFLPIPLNASPAQALYNAAYEEAREILLRAADSTPSLADSQCFLSIREELPLTPYHLPAQPDYPYCQDRPRDLGFVYPMPKPNHIYLCQYATQQRPLTLAQYLIFFGTLLRGETNPCQAHRPAGITSQCQAARISRDALRAVGYRPGVTSIMVKCGLAH